MKQLHPPSTDKRSGRRRRLVLIAFIAAVITKVIAMLTTRIMER